MTLDPESSKALKAELRNRNIAARRALPKEDALAAAERAADHAMHLIEHAEGKVVALYSPVQGELKVAPLAERLRAAGAKPALPKVADPEVPMHFRLWLDQDPLEKGFGNIREPDVDAPAAVPDVVIVPLSAFDRRGFRVGYGQGHYDRTLGALAREERPLTIGYAFALQEVDEVPRELHDVPLDAVVTENEIIRITPRVGGVDGL
ncbi:5-formyltetrahydrofolate cyclo-ligase [Terrihabitans sp. B22-R8]|uniref:5-formyltetrahydrofolate cyclo-ligase n=1 Tax=Terrihabitans sp. B22-R8 TaxID=3425128 RepID=UPI00403C6742